MPNYAVLYHSQLPANEQTVGVPSNWPSRIQDIGSATVLPPEYAGWNLLTEASLQSLRASLEPTVSAVSTAIERRRAAPVLIYAELTRRITIAAGRPWYSEKLASLTADGIRLLEKRDRTGALTTAEQTRLTAVGSAMAQMQTLVERADALLTAWNSGQTPDIYSDANRS